jgi:hypothetical protein
MEEGQYREICKTCDEILMDDSSGIACTAIPFLHIIREHPVFLIMAAKSCPDRASKTYQL